MARERAARRRPRTRALGDHARWMAFAAPYGALVLTLSARGYELKGHIGTAWALCVSALVLPYWRAWCGRPVFAFYGLALGRYRRKRGDGAFERETTATFAEAVRDNAPAFARELASFVRGACEGKGELSGVGGDVADARQPSEKMRDAGWGTIPLHDATLDAPSRLAARCFPSTSAVVASVGGFLSLIHI